MAHEHLDACRLRGLVIDEDFERGVSPIQRRIRTALLAVVVVGIGAATTFVAVPERAPVQLQQRGFKSHSSPAKVHPLAAPPIRRIRANA